MPTKNKKHLFERSYTKPDWLCCLNGSVHFDEMSSRKGLHSQSACSCAWHDGRPCSLLVRWFMEVIFSSFIVTCFIRAGKDSNISASGAKLIVITFGIYWMFARTSWDSPGYKDVLIYRFSWTLQATVMPFVRSCFIFDLAALSSTLLVNWTEGQAASLLGICVFTFLWN